MTRNKCSIVTILNFFKQKSCARQAGLLRGLFVMITDHPISCTRGAHSHYMFQVKYYAFLVLLPVISAQKGNDISFVNVAKTV